MSVEEHKQAAEGRRAIVQVVVVSSTRTAKSDESGVLLTQILEEAGHDVIARHVVDDDARAIQEKVSGFATDGRTDLVLLTGGTGLSRRDITADAVHALIDTPIPGFGELFRYLSWQQVGSAAMLSRATAGRLGDLLVFALPGSPKACRLAADELIVPELPHLLRERDKEGAPASSPPADMETDVAGHDDEQQGEAEDSGLPDPSGSLGVLGKGRLDVTSEEVVRTEGAAPDERPIPAVGWRRAVYEVEGEIRFDQREDLPWEFEKISPVVDVLHTAGEVAVLKLPSGIKYSLYGWPDLRRDNSKVLAIGWGEPVAEVLALHRYPHLTGTCIEEDRGFLPNRHADLAEVCEQVTGRAPKDTSGLLFAIQPDTVWYERDNAVYKWDGSKERNDGTRTQVISSLVLHWSNR